MQVCITIIYSASDEGHLIRKLSQSYLEAGYEVNFIGWDRLRTLPNSRLVDGLQSKHIMRGCGFSNWKLLFALPLWAGLLLYHCLWLRTDLIHVFDFDSAVSVAIINVLRGIPFIYDIQDNFGQRHRWPFPLNKFIRWMDDWTANRAAGILVTDENRIIDFLEKYRDKILIIPDCAPDLKEQCSFDNYKTGNREEPRPFTVMALGNLSKQRGIELLLDAIKHLPDVHVLMAGRFVDQSLQQRALSMAQVDFRGWLPMEDALRLASQTDVIFTFYDPSIEINQRASSNKWYDAMMLAKPVLVNTELLKSNWIEQEGFGFLCSYGDIEALVKCLKYIQDHPQEAVQKGLRGRELYESKFNWPVMEQKILNMVKQIIG